MSDLNYVDLKRNIGGNKMTTLETILIIYILLSWLLTIIFTILPKRVINKACFLFIIVCPPLIIGIIGELISKLIKEKHNKRKNKKEEIENEKSNQV